MAPDAGLQRPLLALFDFGAAFPSLYHAWLLACLDHAGLPLGALNICIAAYTIVQAFARTVSNPNMLLFLIMRGVLQGCPFSGTIFVIALDPFLCLFELALQDPGGGEPLGILRACADDLGVSLRARSALIRLHDVFLRAASVAGLELKNEKVVLIPVWCELVPRVAIELKDWLLERVPGCAGHADG